MATFYLILVIILFFLAISDLVVGVSNDAVNFLNSAVGARASSFRVILLVAALGVLVGATFSSGMMEVARKGIFHPEYFYFSDIIIIFLAVMITDVILLDTFNTFGLPTSTTVSIVFELLGAAVAISIIKVITDPNALQIHEYINSGKALAIVAGILLSVVIAFSAGVIAQFTSRLFFSFDYDKRMRRFGPIWGGIGITAITYFMLIKGAKGASFMSADFVDLINNHTGLIMLVSLVGWTIILYALNRLFKTSILRVLVLVGTFALAMAFAGNDLVNFIGVPLAGYNSYQIFMESNTGPDSLLMNGLAGQVPTPTFLLLIAGIIMVITLYTSKKAKSVVKTSLDLGRQEEGYERFSSSLLSRSLVRNFSGMAVRVQKNLPEKWHRFVDRQFNQAPFIKRQLHQGEEAPAFDMIRASVTLVIASILIAIGTNLKLPLSTTYVTFMVFMGTSLADGAWGRESAVYRVTGVLSVIGGWFFTALSAFVVASIIASIFYFGGMPAIVILILISAFVVYRTHRLHNKRTEALVKLEKRIEEGSLTKVKVIDLAATELKSFLQEYDKTVETSINELKEENLGELRENYHRFKSVQSRITSLRNNSSNALDRVPEDELEAGHIYILVVDYLHEMSQEIMELVRADRHHVDNNHKPLLKEQIEDLLSLHVLIKEAYQNVVHLAEELDDKRVRDSTVILPRFLKKVRSIRKKQIKRIKNHEVGTRNSILFFNHLGELRNLMLFCHRIVKVFDEFILNPIDDGEVIPSEIKKDLESMREEAQKENDEVSVTKVKPQKA